MNDKTIKRELRKMGVAHGDAAAFIRVYKKIRQKGKGRMVRDIMAPMLPAGVANLELGPRKKIGRMYAEHWVPAQWLELTPHEHLDRYFRLDVAGRLAEELVGGNTIVWTQRMEMKGGQSCYVLRGALEVVLPEEEGTGAKKPKLYAEQVFDKVTRMEPWG